MHVKGWTVARPGELWTSEDGAFDVARVGVSDWRLTEVVRFAAATGVRLVVMEHDRRFHTPHEAVLHVSRLRQQRSREPDGRDGIIGRGRRRKEAAA